MVAALFNLQTTQGRVPHKMSAWENRAIQSLSIAEHFHTEADTDIM